MPAWISASSQWIDSSVWPKLKKSQRIIKKIKRAIKVLVEQDLTSAWLYFIMFFTCDCKCIHSRPVGLICRAAEIRTKNRTHVQASQRHYTPPAKVEGFSKFFIRMLKSLHYSSARWFVPRTVEWPQRMGGGGWLCQSITKGLTAGFENLVSLHERSVIKSKMLRQLHCCYLPAGCSSSSLQIWPQQIIRLHLIPSSASSSVTPVNFIAILLF